MVNGNFVDDLMSGIALKNSRIVVGLDSDPRRIPLLPGRDAALSARQLHFNRIIIDAVADVTAIVKIQIAFYEMLGAAGLHVFWDTVKHAQGRGLLVIGDVKRGDIGSTADAYAEAYFGGSISVDAVTVNPYLGLDSVTPFLRFAERSGRGIFVLVRTSNPSSSDFQDLTIRNDPIVPLYEVVGHQVERWNKGLTGQSGYGLVGAVVGATFPGEAERLRRLLPETLFLVPGYGAQGGRAADVVCCFDAQGQGAIVNASRSIIFAYESSNTTSKLTDERIAASARAAAEVMRDQINLAIDAR